MAEKKEEFDLVVLGDQISETVEKYWKPFLVVVGLGLVVASVMVFMQRADSDKEAMAFSKLFVITEKYQAKKADFEAGAAQAAKKANPKKSESDKEEEKPSEDESPKPVASGDLEKDYGQIVADLEAFVKNNPGRQATGEATLLLAGIYQDHDKNQQAVDVLSKTLSGWKGQNLITSIMKMKTGDLWSQIGDCTKALGFWTPLTGGNGFLKSEATLKVGLCHQKLGQSSQAKEWFQKLTSTDPESPSGLSAKKFLRFLQFQEKLPPAASDQSQEGAEAKDKES